jgi:hypothetical protein
VRLEHETVVDAPLERTWEALVETGRGAGHRGTVRLADVPYSGIVRLLDADADEHVATFQARAGDDGAPGTAAAIVRHRLNRAGDRTKISVAAELELTGRGARLGRDRLEGDAGRIVDEALGRILAAPEGAPAREQPPPRRRRHVGAAAIAAAVLALVVLRRVRYRR